MVPLGDDEKQRVQQISRDGGDDDENPNRPFFPLRDKPGMIPPLDHLMDEIVESVGRGGVGGIHRRRYHRRHRRHRRHRCRRVMILSRSVVVEDPVQWQSDARDEDQRL